MWQKRSICYFHELEDQIDVNLVDNRITSVAFDRELCKGQGTWGIPIMFLALTRLQKGEPTIHSIKSSPSSKDRTTLGLGGQGPLDFFKNNIIIYINVLILTILFYKITFYFSLTIS